MSMLALDTNPSWQPAEQPADSSAFSSFVTRLIPGWRSSEQDTLTFATAQRSHRDDELRDALERLKGFLALGKNWNSYRSEQVSFQAIQGSFSLLMTIYQRHDVPIPALVPTASGGIQMEWHENSCDLEIEFESSTRADLYFEQEGHEPVEIPLTNDFTALSTYLDQIATC